MESIVHGSAVSTTQSARTNHDGAQYSQFCQHNFPATWILSEKMGPVGVNSTSTKKIPYAVQLRPDDCAGYIAEKI